MHSPVARLFMALVNAAGTQLVPEESLTSRGSTSAETKFLKHKSLMEGKLGHSEPAAPAPYAPAAGTHRASGSSDASVQGTRNIAGPSAYANGALAKPAAAMRVPLRTTFGHTRGKPAAPSALSSVSSGRKPEITTEEHAEFEKSYIYQLKSSRFVRGG
jgi:hypothetical protein